MDKIQQIAQESLHDSNYDCIAVGVIDFKSADFSSFQLSRNELYQGERLFFDLASLTKPLTMGCAFLKDESLFDQELTLLLEHRSGLPAWGRLSHDTWREQISSYQIKESDVRYSDFGALRTQIEIEKKLAGDLYSFVGPMWGEEIKSWKDLRNEISPMTGLRNKKQIMGQVHDDNAFVINEKLSHAGLFGTVDGVCLTLLKLNSDFNLLSKINKDHSHRFYKGWDTVQDPTNTLAGKGCSEKTFGHLGFTGTSIWIDPTKEKGHVILTNEVLGFWYSRHHLSNIRKAIGTQAWS
jgi:hypothetical protein